MRKAIVSILVLGILCPLAWYGYRKLGAPKPEPASRRSGGPLAVELSPVRRAPICDLGRFTGTLHAREQFVVAPRIAGRLDKLLVDVSDSVKGGQTIAVLDAAEYEQQVAQAEAELAEAKANASQVPLNGTLEDEELTQKAAQAKAELAVARANAEQVRLGATLEDLELVQKAAQAQAELESASASLSDARSALDVARRELDRVQALQEKKILSTAELDTADAQYKAAKARQETALAMVSLKEAAVKSAQVRLSETQKSARAAELLYALSLVEQKEAAWKVAQVRLSETQKSARAAEVQLALAQVELKEAALKAAQVRLSYTQIAAPVWGDGKAPWVVGERFVDGGAMLKANDPIISLLDIAALKAVIYVTERDYPKLRTGQDVAVTTDAAPDRSFTGRIVRVASLLDQTSRQARVEVEVPNDDGLLKPGMFIRARVEFARQENALVIPASAFVKREGGLGFFVADRQAMKARFVAARSGIAEGDLAEILEPAQAVENALIVTLGQHLLEDGSPIAIPGEKPAPGPKAAEASQATPAPASPKGS